MNSLNITLLAFLSLAIVAFAPSKLAHATPAPYPQDELERLSDLIVEADVECIAKVGRPDAPAWYARLHVRKTIKGRVPSNPMIYWFSPAEEGIVGTRNECVFPGEHVVLYLIFENNRYVSWASNSIDLLEGVPDEQRVLPTRVGQVILAPRKSKSTPGLQTPSCR